MTSNELRYSRQRPVRHRFTWDKFRNAPVQLRNGAALYYFLWDSLCSPYAGYSPVNGPVPRDLYYLARHSHWAWPTKYCLFAP